MTIAQQAIASVAAHTTDTLIARYERAAGRTFEARELRLIRGGLISALVGLAREVAQINAQDRAEIARMADADVITFVQRLLNQASAS